MKPYYKVWVCVEYVDEDNDRYIDIDLPWGSVAQFENETDAIAFAAQLQDYADWGNDEDRGQASKIPSIEE